MASLAREHAAQLSQKLQGEVLSRLFEEIQDYAIILLDTNGTVMSWNAGAQRIKGYTSDEIVGQNFNRFYTAEDRAQNRPQTLLAEAFLEGRATDEGWRVRKDGTRFWGSITITSIHGSDGKVIGYGKVTHDLTDAKKAEQSRLLEARNKELEQFTYIASHDLQEPLRTISNYIQIIREEFTSSTDTQLRKYVGRIADSAERMRNLIHALLDYARLGQKIQLAEINTNTLVREAIADLQGAISETGASLRVGELPTLKGYPVELRRLFQNLFSNALKFRRTGIPPEIHVYAEYEIKRWHFQVRDNGVGIAPEHLTRIFQLFQRIAGSEKKEGHGIGLTGSKKIAELHGGTIWVESLPGHGSTFHFTISTTLL